jgi:uncharacterized protein DUF4232
VRSSRRQVLQALGLAGLDVFRGNVRLTLKPTSLLPIVLAAACLVGLGAGSARSQATKTCTTAGLVVWLNTQSNHAAGSAYYELEFTNLSGHACALRGYPGVSAVNLAGHQLGSAAGRDHAHPARLIRLGRGGSAAALIQVLDALNFPHSTCHQKRAAGLRVYPPGQRTAKAVPFPFLACSRTGRIYLRVRAVQVR